VIESLSLLEIALAILAVLAGAAVQAAIGMGLNLFTVPILALIDPVFVPGPVLLHSFLLSCAASYGLRADIKWRELGISVVGLIAGTIAGAIALAMVSADVLPQVFGWLVVVAVAVTAAGLHIPVTTPALITASTLAGAMGTVAGMHGPPIGLLYQREIPSRVRGALLPFFMFANGLSLIALAAIGRFGWPEFYASALLLPGLVTGFLAAPLLMRLLGSRAIRFCLLAISGASGLVLVLRG
jgi:uncharacterized membrane protein YfcA